MIKKLLLAISFFPVYLFSQVDLSTPIATGKGGVATAITQDWQCLGINPANLGFQNNYKFSMGLGGFGFSAQSKAIDLSTMYNAIATPNAKFTEADKQRLATKFATPDGLNLYANINWFAASVYIPKVGGFAINMRDRISGHATLGQNTADVIFNGSNAQAFQDSNVYKKPISTLLDGTHLSYFHYRELNLSYGRKILGKEDAVELYGGIGAKYLWGLANMDVKAANNQISGNASFSSDYGFNINNIRNFSPQNTNYMFNTVGHGFAVDLGTSLKIKGRFTFSASVTDIGSINWSKNTLVVSDTTVPKLDTSKKGLASWDPNSLTGFIYNSLSGMVHYKQGNGYSTALPSRLRLGTGIKLGKKVLVGADVVMPLNQANGNLENAYFALGGEVGLWGTAKISTGIAGNKNYGFAVPLGFTLGTLGITEFYIATGDVLTFISKSRNPQLSFAMATFRFNLKNPVKNEVK